MHAPFDPANTGLLIEILSQELAIALETIETPDAVHSEVWGEALLGLTMAESALEHFGITIPDAVESVLKESRRRSST